MILGQKDLIDQALLYDFSSILDIGAGDFFASKCFKKAGKKVTATGFDIDSYNANFDESDIQVFENVDVCDMSIFSDHSFDAIWCAHVLEHIQDTGSALKEIHRILKPNGILFVSLPEYSPLVVGGHVTPGWNLGILMYNLLLSGFDTRNGAFINHCWNITGFVRKTENPLPNLRHDKGDIEVLADLFPSQIEAKQAFNGDLMKVNWEWAGELSSAEKRFKKACRRKLLQSLTPPRLRYIIKQNKLRSNTLQK